MESKLTERIVRQIPKWQEDFKSTKGRKSQREARIWMPMYSEIKQEIEALAIPKYRNLFVELARDPLGFYTCMRTSPHGEFDDDCRVWYEKTFFEIEEFACTENPYIECRFNMHSRAEASYCPTECKLKKRSVFVNSLKDPWMRLDLIKFCVDNYSLTDEEKREIEDNLEIVRRYEKIVVKPFGEEPTYSTIHDSIKALTEGKPQASLFGVGYYFPRIARKVIELRDKQK